jgi:hypothetical protein
VAFDESIVEGIRWNPNFEGVKQFSLRESREISRFRWNPKFLSLMLFFLVEAAIGLPFVLQARELSPALSKLRTREASGCALPHSKVSRVPIWKFAPNKFEAS